MENGDPIWVESLLNDKEYAEMAKKYPNTYPKGSKKVQEFSCDFKWRKGMGAVKSAAEITAANIKLDKAFEILRKLQKERSEVTYG